jgi:putative glycerol-1-phosphate prenyltransferase
MGQKYTFVRAFPEVFFYLYRVKKPQLLARLTAPAKKLAILIDPDRSDEKQLVKLCREAKRCKADFFLIGGSLLVNGNLGATLTTLKKNTDIPLILFPGSALQVHPRADGILLLSLISGRNPELLIGQHVQAAPLLKKSKLEIIPTGYILVDGGKPTTVSYITQTQPIPANKPEIAACTALAGEQLGLRCIYLEAGSGAENPVQPEMIAAVKQELGIPLIVGGGLRSAKQVEDAWHAGADIVVIGTAIENDPDFLRSLKAIVR